MTSTSGHESSDGGDATPSVSSSEPGNTPACSNKCELDAVACAGEREQLTVKHCVTDEATGCTVWEEVEDCEAGSCVPALVEGGCDPADGIAKCVGEGLVVCAPNESGCPVWQTPTDDMQTGGNVEVDESATEFTGYGELSLQLTTDVSESELVVCLRDTREAATSADSPQVTALDAQGGGEFALTLSRYQLPVAYELAVAIGSPPVVRAAVLAPDVKSKVAFISTTKGTGDLASWTIANDGPLEAADAVCQADAEAAGLHGSFKAFLSIDAQTDGVCRLHGGEGVVASGCGLGAQPSEARLTAPFLDMKGLPIAYGTNDIADGVWRLPVGYDAEGVRGKINGSAAWTGGTTAGLAGNGHCEGWSSAAEGAFGIAAGSPGVRVVSDGFTMQCNRSYPLLCFSVPDAEWPLSRAHERSGKLAYVIEATPNLVIEDADAACEASKPEGVVDVVAWFSDASSDAICRLIGRGGKVEDDCDGESIDWMLGPWVRSDGYMIAESLEGLTGPLAAPLSFGSDGVFLESDGPELVRTDTFGGGVGGLLSNQCGTGDRLDTSSGWTFSGTVSCSDIIGIRTLVYCLER